MAFKPSSTIYLCNVPFDSSYKNQVYFTSEAQQYAYFAGKMVTRFSEYLTVRESLPDGTLQSSVKVGANIDDLRNCNYMFYQNANHGAKFFYCFIKKLVYINEKTTQIIFETDVYQTWRFNVTLLDSYVVREHSETDKLFENTVPEPFNPNDFTYKKEIDLIDNTKWGYLVTSSDPHPDNESVKNGRLMSGIFQGLYFYYYDNATNLAAFLAEMLDKNADCVQSITLIPSFCMGWNSIGTRGLLAASENPAYFSTGVTNFYKQASFGFTPKNNKLYTYPYTCAVVTNHRGGEAEYKLEDFSDPYHPSFIVYGDVCANPSMVAIPKNYKGLSEAHEHGVSVSGFPQCSFNSDSFKLWLSKNQFSAGVSIARDLGLIVGGIATTAVTKNPAALAGSATGAFGILNTISDGIKSANEPNKTDAGNSSANLLTAIGQNTLSLYVRTIKNSTAQTIDNFFTMYGYQTNRVKKPNVSKRPYFNYVQTVDVNITGGIPNDDMEKLKAMYNNGVTLWKPNATIGNYSVNNAP